MYFSRKTYKRYQKRRRASQAAAICPFCDPAEIEHRLVFQTDLSYVIPNQTSYEVWEFHEVLDHLMVIPKRHVEHLSELTDAEVLDIGHIIGRYDALGYSSYARAPLNRRRSVRHQHTHLIKIADKPVRFSLLLTKPYHLIKF